MIRDILLMVFSGFLFFVLVYVTKYNIHQEWMAAIFSFFCVIGIHRFILDIDLWLKKYDNTKA